MKQILIVDDSKVIRKVAQRILQSLDFMTREAENGRSDADHPDEHEERRALRVGNSGSPGHFAGG